MAKKSNKGGYTVLIAFKDSKQYATSGVANSYEVGADVSDLDAERLEILVKRGIVFKNSEKEE